MLALLLAFGFVVGGPALMVLWTRKVVTRARVTEQQASLQLTTLGYVDPPTVEAFTEGLRQAVIRAKRLGIVTDRHAAAADNLLGEAALQLRDARTTNQDATVVFHALRPLFEELLNKEPPPDQAGRAERDLEAALAAAQLGLTHRSGTGAATAPSVVVDQNQQWRRWRDARFALDLVAERVDTLAGEIGSDDVHGFRKARNALTWWEPDDAAAAEHAAMAITRTVDALSAALNNPGDTAHGRADAVQAATGSLYRVRPALIG